jgi:hypothetical protein
MYDSQLYDQHARFAALWDIHLKAQGFLEAFSDNCILG